MYMSSSNRKADSGEASVLPEVSRDGRSMVWRKELGRGQGCWADRQMQNLRCLPRCLRGEFVVPWDFPWPGIRRIEIFIIWCIFYGLVYTGKNKPYYHGTWRAKSVQMPAESISRLMLVSKSLWIQEIACNSEVMTQQGFIIPNCN